MPSRLLPRFSANSITPRQLCTEDGGGVAGAADRRVELEPLRVLETGTLRVEVRGESGIGVPEHPLDVRDLGRRLASDISIGLPLPNLIALSSRFPTTREEVGARAVLTVRDHGVGIPAERPAFVFAVVPDGALLPRGHAQLSLPDSMLIW